MEELYRAVAQELRRARRVLAITGAGISADSGLPTYRGVAGLYNDGPTEDDVPIEEALSGEMLRARPELTWKYLLQIEAACRGAGHNAAHAALALMQDRFERFTVLTQNIDGFHRSAGTRDLIEIHGCAQELECMDCGRRRQVRDYACLDVPPRCSACGGRERPRVVLFGELLPEEAVERLYAVLDEGVDLVLTIGTTSVFPYIAGPVVAAAREGLPTVEINPDESEVSAFVRYRLRERAAVALPALLAQMSDAVPERRPR